MSRTAVGELIPSTPSTIPFLSPFYLKVLRSSPMFKSLQNIQSPFTRMLTAGLTASAIVTLSSAVIIGLTAPKKESAHQSGVYASLIAALGGGILGLTLGGSKQQSPSPHSTSTSIATSIATSTTSATSTVEKNAWTNWRSFTVLRKVQESEEITSFYLKPEDNEAIPSFKPGQFLTIQLEIPGQDRPIIRTYSLSDYQTSPDYYRLSIKREGVPKGLEVPPGIASNFMHDRVEVGTTLLAKPPNGKFFLNIGDKKPIVLISNGVGITPMIAMAKAVTLQNPDRPLWFIHGARSGQYHAFREEIKDLGAQNSHLLIHYAYSRPEPEDEGQYDSQGYADTALVKRLVAEYLPEADYFLCGSPPFMDSLREGLVAEGVAANRIFFEAFSKGMPSTSAIPKVSVTGERGESDRESSEGRERSENSESDRLEVVFNQSQKTVNWTPEAGTLLELAESNNLNPAYSCRSGICLTCMCQLKEGEIEYVEPPIGTPDAGSVLICISRPKSAKIVLEL